ncbi:MAG: hypothetical protein SPL79_12480 [Sphaerochaetaceae bacterium]|jgi:hypothetical protein|nr:hypothetical protein [Spirochaetaceae bacterium]MDY6345101.1 hypothetical protein [Sphaerochaetaceae bacterium]
MEANFRTDFEQACRRHGIYTPHRMDAGKLKEKWAVFQDKCPEDYQAMVRRYPTVTTWENLMHLYFKG